MITPPDLPHIWEGFFSGKNITSESAGLGLALVKYLVEAMGGSVAVESAQGQGSCFTVRLKKPEDGSFCDRFMTTLRHLPDILIEFSCDKDF